jgi:ABC-type lipoprotein release transport system permease subunit
MKRSRRGSKEPWLTIAMMVVTTLSASLLPALRVTRIDPVRALAVE